MTSSFTPASALRAKKAFYLLMATDFWERFSYYSMQFLLVIYATDAMEKGGLGWSNIMALQLVGLYGSAAYILPLLGGLVADRYLGQKITALAGAALMALGHFTLVFHHSVTFFSALVLLVFGCGLFKPNIPAMIAEVYKDSAIEKSNAYNTLSVITNLGAALAGISTGFIQARYGYHLAFTTAGFGMLIGCCTLALGSAGSLKGIGEKPLQKTLATAVKKLSLKQLINSDPFTKNRYKVYLFLTTILLVQYCFYFIITNGPLTLYLETHVNRQVHHFTIPTPWFLSLDAAVCVASGVVWNMIFTWQAQRQKQYTVPVKVGCGLVGLAFCFALIAYGSYGHNPSSLAPVWPFILFFIISNIFLMLINPVILYASNEFVPQGTQAFHSAIYFFMIGIASYVASWVGALMFAHSAALVFCGVGVIMCILGGLTLVLARRLNRLSLGLP